ncbi:MAG TPA: hypothetical protein VIF60_08560 [Burkholderiaceae bacterium]|jgi:hypothetical protein
MSMQKCLHPAIVPGVDSASEASAPYPPDKTGKIPHSFISTNRLRDKQP